MSQSAIRVMLVDDHAIVREGLMAVLRSRAGIEVVAEARDAAGAVARFQQHRPDVTLLDLRLPDTDGIQVLGMLRAIAPDARVIVLTSYQQDDDIWRALQAGARGYLLKSVTGNELADAIARVHQGKTAIPPDIAERVVGQSLRPGLSLREREVVQLVADGRSNKEIAATLSLEIGTVKAYLSSAFAKLGVTSRTQAVMVALERGLVKGPRQPG